MKMDDRTDLVKQVRVLCETIAWGDTIAAHERGTAALEFAARPHVLGALLETVANSDDLRTQCEKFNLFSKIVLMASAAKGWKLRLHVFDEEVLEAHHHRASFCAKILAGGYKHLLFGANARLEQDRLSFPLKPLFVQTQAIGSAYMIDSEMVHSTLARERTVSLMLQAPIDREAFDIYELRTGTRRMRVGAAATQGHQEDGEQRLDEVSFNILVKELRDMSLAI
jgi:hypothetical protein